MKCILGFTICFLLFLSKCCEEEEYTYFTFKNNSDDTVFYNRSFDNDTNKELIETPEDTIFVKEHYREIAPNKAFTLGLSNEELETNLNYTYFIMKVFHPDSVYIVPWKEENYDRLVLKRYVIKINDVDEEVIVVYP